MNKWLNKSWFFLKLLQKKATGAFSPLLILFNVTHRCNLRCSYCFGKYYERKNEELSTDNIYRLIDQLSALGTHHLGIGGGEPLLRSDIGYIIGYAKAKKLTVGLNTNGILLPQKMPDIKNVDTLCISLDGNEEAHDFYRGKGSFKKALAAIECSVKNGIETHVSAVLTKKNVNDLEFLLNISKELGTFLEVAPLYNQFYGEKNPHYPDPLSDKEYRSIFRYLIDLKKDKKPIFFSQTTYEYILNWPDYRCDKIIGKVPDFKHAKCYAGKYFCHIEANGDVYPCAYFTGHKALNCLETNFKDAFANIRSHPCRACSWACYNEFNLIFDLNPGILRDLVWATLT